MLASIDYSSLLLLHSAAVASMVGLIWFVQIVHYPLFAEVGEEVFASYAARHQQLTAWVVVPPMLVEAASAPLVLALAPQADRPLAWIALLLLGGVWASTFLQLVPRHRRLLLGFDRQTIRDLVRVNLLRAALWSARGVICLVLLARA